MPCPSPSMLVDFVERGLDATSNAAIERHLDSCGACRQGVAELVEPMDAAPASGLRRGARLGRYELLELIGGGAMGSVFAARDSTLNRHVALKVTLQRGEALLDEARVLATLRHQNVVTIFDVGVWEGRVWLALELIEGEALREWLRPKRATAQLVEVLAQAARGLAAVHRAGFVHGDVKADNVLVGRDGVVRVADFGLAHRGHRQQRVVAGTPAYLAPEALWGQVDARSDQYSFCVMLVEALCGVRLRHGDAVPSALPRRIAAIAKRGLSVNPSARFQSMDVLAEALTRRPRWKGVAPWVAVGVLGLVIGGAVTRSLTLCRGAAQEIAESWNASAQGRVTQAFLATGLPSASFAAGRTVRALDAWAAGWAAMKTSTCEATRVHETQSEGVLEQRMQCLDVRRRDFAAVVQVLAAADSTAVLHAEDLVAQLRPLAQCAELERFDGSRHAPHAQAAQVRDRLSLSRALRSSGKPQEALASAREALELAVATPALLAPARLQVGQTLHALDLLPESEKVLEQAFVDAEQLHDDAVAIDAAGELASVTGISATREEDGLRWAKIGQGLAGRQSNAAEGAYLKSVTGDVLYHAGKFEQALTLHEAALAIRTRVLPAEHVELAQSHNNLAATLERLGRSADALAQWRQALAIWEHVLGPNHPDVATARSNLGVALQSLGRADEAMVEQRAALELRHRVWPAGHSSIAESELNVGTLEYDLGRFDEALARADAALKGFDAAFGARSVQSASAHSNRGNALLALGRPADALPEMTLALELYEARFGPANIEVATSRGNLANALQALGRLDDAEREARAALESTARALGPRSRQAGVTRANLGSLLSDRKKSKDAIVELREAAAILEEAAGPASSELMVCQANLANALADSGQLREAAEAYRKVIALQRETLGEDHVNTARTRGNLGLTLIELKQLDQARAEFEASLKVFQAQLPDSIETATFRFGLAQTLTRKNAEQARLLAKEARAWFVAQPGSADAVREIDQWLSRHR